MTTGVLCALEMQGGSLGTSGKGVAAMDRRRFDAIARASAGANNRRELLRAIAALVCGGVGFELRGKPTRAQSPAACVQNSDCFGGAADPCTGASCDGGLCTYFIVSCIPGFVCCGNGACCPAAAQCQSDLDCAEATDDPCAGATCENGVCVPFILTCAAGFVCCKGTCAVSCYDMTGD